MGPPKVPSKVAKVTPSNSGQTILSGAEEQPCQVYGYPTVLVACDDDGLGGSLVNYLQQNGFHVLEADDWAHVFHAVKMHSRSIHVLVADVGMNASVPTLKAHRSGLQVLLVKTPVDADDVLAKVRQLLGSPPSLASIR